ncbi:GDP-mannose 4,6-dehydratase [Saccharopolyspora sp. NFXS83]|uniref:NAD-dependent epimerase/dehydratase family protein n=1 Tax=Saccharopolyspora sp. NFXS83 TaxID=2993560 RepID=UPI00224B0995|nr:NAD-dependent epimerase/dehydratase family protein [Saccharopolyspora sp. NFXS83]MCX2730256.1 GDP-mannose 4,6-dehydratase [Saccharopolyspora sp. NFXS83]
MPRPRRRAARPAHRGRPRRGVFEPRCPTCDGLLEPGTVPEDAPVDPRNTYATTKLPQEHLAAVWARNTGGSAVSLRCHSVYGPRMPRNTPYAGVASLFRSALARGEAPRIFEDGGQRRDFVHVRDIAAPDLAAMRREEPGFAAYNACSGRPRTIGDMATALAEAADGPAPITTGNYRLGDVRHIMADPRRATEEIGFHAQAGFAEGMREFDTAALRA